MLENQTKFTIPRRNISLSTKIKEKHIITLGPSNKKTIISQDFNRSLKKSKSFQNVQINTSKCFNDIKNDNIKDNFYTIKSNKSEINQMNIEKGILTLKQNNIQKENDFIKNNSIKEEYSNKLNNTKNSNTILNFNMGKEFKEEEGNNEKEIWMKKNNEYNTCFLCERSYLTKELFCSKCNIHLFCNLCLNLIFKKILESDIPSLECPESNCNFEFDLDYLKDIIDEKIYNELSKIKIGDNNKSSRNKIKVINVQKSIPFTQRSIIGLMDRNEFNNIVEGKKLLCPKCERSDNYYLSCSHFYKCLFCKFKICKYCFKEYTKTHLISNMPDTCKVYLRMNGYHKKSIFYLYLMQLIYVIAIFILCIIISFIKPLNFCKKTFNIYKNNNNNNLCLKLFFSYIISIIIMIIALPFIIILFPYFPSFIQFIDINIK